MFTCTRLWLKILTWTAAACFQVLRVVCGGSNSPSVICSCSDSQSPQWGRQQGGARWQNKLAPGDNMIPAQVNQSVIWGQYGNPNQIHQFVQKLLNKTAWSFQYCKHCIHAVPFKYSCVPKHDDVSVLPTCRSRPQSTLPDPRGSWSWSASPCYHGSRPAAN